MTRRRRRLSVLDIDSAVQRFTFALSEAFRKICASRFNQFQKAGPRQIIIGNDVKFGNESLAELEAHLQNPQPIIIIETPEDASWENYPLTKEQENRFTEICLGMKGEQRGNLTAISARFSPATVDYLETTAEALGISRSEVIRGMVEYTQRTSPKGWMLHGSK